MTATTTGPARKPPYAASWADRLTAAVAARFSQPFLVYLAASVVLASVVTVVEWLVGAYPVGQVRPVHLVAGAISPLWLWLIGIFNAAGERAVLNLRPMLTLDDAGVEDLRHRFTAIPALPTAIIFVATATGSVLRLILDPKSLALIEFPDDPLSFALVVALVVLLTFCGTAFVLKQIWSAWQVHRISTRFIRVDLARVNLLYGLSGLTGRMAASQMLSATAFYATSLESFSDAYGIWLGVLSIVIAAVVFVLPLVGIHEHLAAAKEAAFEGATSRFQHLTAELHEAADARDLAVMDPINKALGALDIELTRVARIPTWPWQPETLRWIVGALMFPIVLFVAQYILSRVLA